MHDGSLVSLEEVVEYYDRGGNTNPALVPSCGPSSCRHPRNVLL